MSDSEKDKKETQKDSTNDVFEVVDPTPGSEAVDSPEKKNSLQEITEQLQNTQKELLYLRAEFDNFRKQSIKERSDLLKFGGEAIARDLLKVLDVFDKALANEVTANNFSSFVDGVKLTQTELKNLLKKHGIDEFETKGKAFNPNTSEALSQVPTDSVENGHVYEVMRKGYSYHDRVLRHAQVVIATNPESKKDSQQSE